MLTGTRERVDAIPVFPVPRVDPNTEEGLNNPSTSHADSVDDDERVAISDGESGDAVDPIPFDLPRRNLRAGFHVLGVSFMRSIPKCLRGVYVGAVRVSMHEILDQASGEVWCPTSSRK